MRTTPNRIWFRKTAHSIEGRIEYHKEVNCINTEKIPFDQELKIREQIKDDIMANIFGQMPRTCLTIIKNLSMLEQSLNDAGMTLQAKRATNTIALVSSLHDQMVVQRPTDENIPDHFDEVL